MTDCDKQQRDQHLRQLVHDVRNCLQVVGMGTEVLKTAREDDRKFTTICESIDKERRTALKLMDEFLIVACEGDA